MPMRLMKRKEEIKSTVNVKMTIVVATCLFLSKNGQVLGSIWSICPDAQRRPGGDYPMWKICQRCFHFRPWTWKTKKPGFFQSFSEGEKETTHNNQVEVEKPTSGFNTGKSRKPAGFLFAAENWSPPKILLFFFFCKRKQTMPGGALLWWNAFDATSSQAGWGYQETSFVLCLFGGWMCHKPYHQTTFLVRFSFVGLCRPLVIQWPALLFRRTWSSGRMARWAGGWSNSDEYLV